MADRRPDLPVRIIGSRELHQNLPAILKELERLDARYVLTVHGKPKAVLIGAEAFRELAGRQVGAAEALVELQLSAMLGRMAAPGDLDAAEGLLSPDPDRPDAG